MRDMRKQLVMVALVLLVLAVACGSTSTGEDIDKLVAEGVQSAVATITAETLASTPINLSDAPTSQEIVVPPTPTHTAVPPTRTPNPTYTPVPTYTPSLHTHQFQLIPLVLRQLPQNPRLLLHCRPRHLLLFLLGPGTSMIFMVIRLVFRQGGISIEPKLGMG